jgi:CRP/FNR family transcriptional regulator
MKTTIEVNLTESHRNCVAAVPIFNHLEEKQLNEIMKIAQTITLRKGDVLYQAGEASQSLYIINKGRLKNYRLTESGKEQLVRILMPGEFSGEYALFTESIHESYAEAMSETSICMIERSDLQEILMKYPSISFNFLEVFSNRIESSEKQTTLFATEKVGTRVALFLAQSMDGSSNIVSLPMTKRDLASYLGTTPETISRMLTKLEEKGYIKRKGNNKIEILNLDGLLLV